MAKLLLELRSEEIPARMQPRAAENLTRLLESGLKAANLEFAAVEAFATPRRVALVVSGLPVAQPDRTEERKGPRVDAPDKAIDGFLRAAGLESLDQCEKRDTPKGAVWFAVRAVKGRATAEVLPEVILEAIRGLSWPKSMRFARQQFRWVRPLSGIVAVFEGAPLDGTLDLGGGDRLDFTDTTVGHRFLAPEPFRFSDLDEYRRALKERYVILDPAVRRERIVAGLERQAGALGLAVRDDPALVDEVVGLVEWPNVLVGAIDEAFMEVPPEVLTASMRMHQKYFALETADGRLAPHFALVANMPADGGARDRNIVNGNERVLRARLADAKFFWDQDRTVPLADRVPALREIVFHARLGTLDQKVDRIEALAVQISKRIPDADRDRVRSAARLCKADLVTGMVGEFPELQGVMGAHYALNDGEHADVAGAIRQHYSPLGPSDACPSDPTAVAVALADKIDTLMGFWLIDEKPTGSKDPYALRRAALGVIRLIVENGVRMKLGKKFFLAARLYSDSVPGLREAFEARMDGKQMPRGQIEDAYLQFQIPDLYEFFGDRLRVALRDQGIRHDLIRAVFALEDEDDLVRLLARVDALTAFLDSDDGANLLTAYKRAANILRIEEKRDDASYRAAPDPGLFALDEESTLHDALQSAVASTQGLVGNEDFEGAMGALAALRSPVDAFFDDVTVNAEEDALRANRLRLLSQIRDAMGSLADFSQIEG